MPYPPYPDPRNLCELEQWLRRTRLSDTSVNFVSKNCFDEKQIELALSYLPMGHLKWLLYFSTRIENVAILKNRQFASKCRRANFSDECGFWLFSNGFCACATAFCVNMLKMNVPFVHLCYKNAAELLMYPEIRRVLPHEYQETVSVLESLAADVLDIIFSYLTA